MALADGKGGQARCAPLMVFRTIAAARVAYPPPPPTDSQLLRIKSADERQMPEEEIKQHGHRQQRASRR